jgi:hypothetical protein
MSGEVAAAGLRVALCADFCGAPSSAEEASNRVDGRSKVAPSTGRIAIKNLRALAILLCQLLPWERMQSQA